MTNPYHRSSGLLLDGYSELLHKRVESAVRRNAYSSDVTSGFRMLVRRPEYFVAEHIERQIREETITDPFGEVTVFERTLYMTSTVMVKITPPHIILLDPSATSHLIIHKLCDFLDFAVAVLRPEIDICTWSERMQSNVFRLRTDDIRIKSVDWGDGFTGSLVLSGEGDVFRKAESITKSRKHSIATIGGTVRIGDVTTRIRLHRTGRIELSQGIDASAHSALYALSDW